VANKQALEAEYCIQQTRQHISSVQYTNNENDENITSTPKIVPVGVETHKQINNSKCTNRMGLSAS